MINKNNISMIWITGGIGFVLATLLMTVGFLSTIFIIIVTLIAAFGGYLLEKNNIDLSRIVENWRRKNQR
ncbi:MAG: DUF2273 domain-containing protein [Leuconostoc gelidum]|jgi:uncharacterized membrane protein|uniref:DUF2273 domain-containing protein n=1 Tax=Leuconostoc gelidum group TaxID=3016637 RepID=UPI0002193A00|nr:MULTISPECIES: DUF2273 domain-containing protein [Leuconostoc gelidum group]MBZ5978269.1 DUF2273 domain-containing protein [Leuconostoc gelidum subsp. gelidum]MBZ5991304.1 DUF2273 domain-containing protein [Leuconostoc gelidum subsp. gelidum]MBZ5997398.1 DUF2273 domain-containing protein [Leuconostoc gasicomitatum]MBZ6001318.1 DUF2273 domain-containing protein [Leuconostoc gelidum subsp. gelidum]MBZ6010849.1 DUF2273 domain-containing protein [Leuconostoc gelidum subsp. aenigmaticum]